MEGCGGEGGVSGRVLEWGFGLVGGAEKMVLVPWYREGIALMDKCKKLKSFEKKGLKKGPVFKA